MSPGVEIDALSFDGATLRATDGSVVCTIDPDGNLDRQTTAALALYIVLGTELVETLRQIRCAIDLRRAHLPPEVAAQLDARLREVAGLFPRYEAARP